MINRKYKKFVYDKKCSLIDVLMCFFVLIDLYFVYEYVTTKNIRNILLAIIATIFIVCIVILYVKSCYIQRTLKFLVDRNRWYEIDGDTYTYIPDIEYKKDKESIVISFGLDGSRISSKEYRNIRETLQDAFNMSCVSAKESSSRINYKLVYDNYFDPLYVDENTDYTDYCTEEELKLSNHITWNFRNVPHALITGSTGSGKTFILLYLLRAFKAINADVVVIDPKGADLLRLGDALDFDVAYEPNMIAKYLRQRKETMEQRYQDFQQVGDDYRSVGLKPCFIVFDEAMSFFSGSAEDKVKKEVQKAILEIILRGRQAGIYVICGTQRGDVSGLGGTGAIRDQLGLRIILCGNNTSETALEMTLGSDFKHIRARFRGKGEGLIYMDGVTDIPQDFKAPRLRNPWIVK